MRISALEGIAARRRLGIAAFHLDCVSRVEDGIGETRGRNRRGSKRSDCAGDGDDSRRIGGSIAPEVRSIHDRDSVDAVLGPSWRCNL